MIKDIVKGVIDQSLEHLGSKGEEAAKEALKAINFFLNSYKVRETPEAYINNFHRYHGQIKILGMKGEPANIESIYVETRLSSSFSTSLNFDLPKHLDKKKDKMKSRLSIRKKADFQGIEIANIKQYLVILGAPGSGKSTFLRRVGIEALKDESSLFRHNCIPVFIELKKFKDEPFDLNNAISEEFESLQLLQTNSRFNRNNVLLKAVTSMLLEKGRLLVLLDGLDELPDEKVREVTDKVDAFTKKASSGTNPETRFILSCRTAAYHSSIKAFTDVEILEFRDQQVKKTIEYWFQSKGKKSIGEELWKDLSAKQYTDAKELAQTPLLLVFICLVYEQTGRFPDQRATLYRNAINILLEEWAIEKEIVRDNPYKGLNTERKLLLLSKIAYQSLFENNTLHLYTSEVCKDIENFLNGNLPGNVRVKGIHVLEDIEIQHGILIRKAKNVCSFSHLTLQEHLTAKYIIENDKIDELVFKYSAKLKWREVFIQVAGLKTADTLLNKLLDKLEKIADNEAIGKILSWVSRSSSQLDKEYRIVDRRACIFVILLYSCVYKIKNDIYIADDIYTNLHLLREDIFYKNSFITPRFNSLFDGYIDALIRLNRVQSVSRGFSRLKTSNRTIDLWVRIREDLIRACKILARCIESDDIIFGRRNNKEFIRNLELLATKVPNIQSNFEIYQSVANRIFQNWIEYANIPSDLLVEAQHNYHLVKEYIILCDLIIASSKEALSISLEVRQRLRSVLLYCRWL